MLDDSTVTLCIQLPDDKVRSAHVHETLLCKASPVFQAALQGKFEEATTKTVTVRDVDLTTFGDFTYWLYRDKCESTPDLMRYAKLNKFADMYDMAWLKYDVCLATLETLKAFIKTSGRQNFVFDHVPQVYAHSAPGDTIRKALVVIYVHELHSTVYKSAESEQCLSTCLEFGSEVAIEMGRTRIDRPSYSVDVYNFPKPVDKSEMKQAIEPVTTTAIGEALIPSTPQSKRRRKH